MTYTKELLQEINDASHLDKWPYKLRGLTKDEIMWAIADNTWQKFRLSLKGQSTRRKLSELKDYWDAAQGSMYDDTERQMMEVQVINYLNALKRGGQLNDNLEVQR